MKSMNMIINFVGNCFEEQNAEFAEKIVKETCFIESLNFFVENSGMLHTDILEYIRWIVGNMTKIVKDGSI